MKKTLLLLAASSLFLSSCQGGPNSYFDSDLPTPKKSTIENSQQANSMIKAAQTYAQFWNTGEEKYAEVLSDDFIDLNLPDGRPQGPTGPLAASKGFRQAVPNLTASMEELIISGDKAISRLNFYGNFTGVFHGRKGDGQSIDFSAIDVYTIQDGKITENWHLEDNLTLLKKLEEISFIQHEDAKQKSSTLKPVILMKDRPGNPAISSDGRLFTTIHPLINPNIKLVEVGENNETKVYPNDTFSQGKDSTFQAGIGVLVDSKNILWALDLAKKSLFSIDINSNKLLSEIKIDATSLVEHSFLQDFVLDEKRNRIIIADMSQGDLKSAPVPAFVVVDLATGTSQRVAQGDSSMLPEEGGQFGLNPIAIDPDFEWLYFGALHGRKVFRVPAESFDTPQTLSENIEYYGPKSYSDGIAVDDAGNVYVTDIESQAIGKTTKNNYEILSKLPQGQEWPDGIVLDGKGKLFVTVNQLNHSAALSADGKETGSGEYGIFSLSLNN